MFIRITCACVNARLEERKFFLRCVDDVNESLEEIKVPRVHKKKITKRQISIKSTIVAKCVDLRSLNVGLLVIIQIRQNRPMTLVMMGGGGHILPYLLQNLKISRRKMTFETTFIDISHQI